MNDDSDRAAALAAWRGRVREIDRRHALIASRRPLNEAELARAAEARFVVELLAEPTRPEPAET